MRRALSAGVILWAAAALGCKTPPFYRQQADAEANCIIDHKAAAVCVDGDQLRIDIDPRSRMADPFNPDNEPQPPDDPVAHKLMNMVDCKKGSRLWKKLPRTPFVDNPNWQAHLPRNARGEVELDLETAVRLGLLESPRYQSELEDLYLSALDVSFERFRFDAQFFGGSQIFYTADGKFRNGGTTPRSDFVVSPFVSPFSSPNRVRMQKLNTTGGTLVAGFANSLMWQFAGPDEYTSSTIFDFTLVQPLLRGAGRTRIMERLTIAERALLGNVRSMERFRQGYYLYVAVGRDPGQGPSRRGGFFGGSGLEGFAGVGGGGFGNVGNFGGGFGGNQGGQGFTGGAGAAAAGGYIGLLQSAQQIRNQRANVASLGESVEQLQATYEAGRIDRFQVDLARQALYNAQSQLLTAENQYQGSLDEFKISQLGLPPELQVKISDDILDEFNLLDPQLEAVQSRVTAILSKLRELRDEANRRRDEAAAAGGVLPAPAEAPPADFEARLEALLAGALDVETQIEQRLAAVDADFAKLEAALPQRKTELEALASRSEVRSARLDPALFDFAALEKRDAARREDFASLKRRLVDEWQRIDQLADNERLQASDVVGPLVETLTNVSGQLLEASLVQAGARLDAITMDPVELTSEEALQIAAAFRLDWQNARMQLVDTWRLIYFNMNDLRSSLNVVFNGDIGNVGKNPLDLRGSNGRLRVGLQWDAPLTRLAERNVYRQALIEYQQARRSYYQFRDRLAQGLRNEVRQVRLNEINFELRRAAVLVAISQVDLTQLRLSEPPKPGEEQQLSNTTARDLVQSLSDLVNVQNDFLSVWVNYEVQRLNLEYDLGVMKLDPTGVRVENAMPLRNYLLCPEVAMALKCRPSDFVAQVEGLELPEEISAGEALGVPDEPSAHGGESSDGPAIIPGEGDKPAAPLPPPAVERISRREVQQLQEATIQAAAALIEWPTEPTAEGETLVLPVSVRPLPPVD